jgi:DNA-binding CsgD family transcriptional regulator
MGIPVRLTSVAPGILFQVYTFVEALLAVHVRTPQLTERQRAVIAHVRQGYSNREIGDKLEISEDGVKAHLSRLYLRYGVTNRVELIASVDENVGATAAAPAPKALRVLANGTPPPAATSPSGSASAAVTKLNAVRDALVAVDAALGLVSDLPPETTEAMISAVKRRLGAAISALDDAQRSVTAAAGGPAA